MDGIEEVVACETIDGVLQLAEDRNTWRYIVAKINVGTALMLVRFL